MNFALVHSSSSSFQTFNEFFYRKLKPEARPIAAPEDDSILVSPADCRLNCFENVSIATELWIKGWSFRCTPFQMPAY